MQLTREKIKRMFDGMGGGGAGGSMDPSMLAGYATQAWVDDMYVSKAFWKELFVIHGTETVEVTDGTTQEVTTTTTDIIFEPNEVPSVTTETDETTGDVTVTTREITSIEAKVGLWTDYFLSALGLNPSGGGGGGTTLNEPLASINNAGLSAHPSTAGQTMVWNGSAWVYGTAGGGQGTVTRVAMTVPTGFSISGSPITNSGTLDLSFATGYSLPLTEDVAKGVTAYGAMHSHSNKSVLDGITSTMVGNWNDAVTGLGLVDGRLQTVEGYFTNGVANSADTAARLSGTASKTAWGQTYWQNGVPNNVSGDMSSVGNITMSGKITIGSGNNAFVIEVDSNGDLKFNGNIYATGGVSALGQSSGGTSLVLNEPLASINSAGLTAHPSSAGQTVVWNGNAWVYGSAGGGSTAWSNITGKPTTIAGYGITDASISGNTITLGSNSLTVITSHQTVSGTFWGNNWNNGDALTGSILINNAQSLQFKDSGGTARNVVTLNASNDFAIGYGTRLAGYTTDIQGAASTSSGTAIQFKVGTSSNGTIGMKILNDGTVEVPTTSPGLRIGNALLSYTNDGLKVSALNGTGSMNLYATGGVSALGVSSGGTSAVLPVPTSSDNGKVLAVVSGDYALVSPTTYYTGSSAPSNSQGQNGDVYLQT